MEANVEDVMTALLALKSEDLRALYVSLNLSEDDPLASRLRHQRHDRSTAPEARAHTDEVAPDDQPPSSYLPEDDLQSEDLGWEEVISGGFIGGPLDVKAIQVTHSNLSLLISKVGG